MRTFAMLPKKQEERTTKRNNNMIKLLIIMLFICQASTDLKDKIYGDFDGDGKRETAYLDYNNIDAYTDYETHKDLYVTYIRFSKSSIPPIKVQDCVGGHLQNLGDLNGDKRDEIGLWFGWPTSFWHSYKSWMLKGRKWRQVTDPFTVHITLWDKYGFNFKPIKKINNQKVRVYYSEWFNEDIACRKKVVRIKK